MFEFELFNHEHQNPQNKPLQHQTHNFNFALTPQETNIIVETPNLKPVTTFCQIVYLIPSFWNELKDNSKDVKVFNFFKSPMYP